MNKIKENYLRFFDSSILNKGNVDWKKNMYNVVDNNSVHTTRKDIDWEILIFAITDKLGYTEKTLSRGSRYYCESNNFQIVFEYYDDSWKGFFCITQINKFKFRSYLYIDDLYDENNNEINQCAAQLIRVYEECFPNKELPLLAKREPEHQRLLYKF
ncbi:hypothetical protein Lsai_1974 [Legionella sainthelensi]|uniref:Uncharacterized protein n=1 Tax=Legionella sainthelensi TaxID=28087 RepID=A0A0W0YH09_9GAMM|nr:hypothetical protein [Legionella sainthelensi]KTD56257.1 hypothetical protein Lsai_1974 [Legionella sainthelensi]VEH31927.1 Uncharacterised protein [Legionella sainthelensi]